MFEAISEANSEVILEVFEATSDTKSSAKSFIKLELVTEPTFEEKKLLT